MKTILYNILRAFEIVHLKFWKWTARTRMRTVTLTISAFIIGLSFLISFIWNLIFYGRIL